MWQLECRLQRKESLRPELVKLSGAEEPGEQPVVQEQSVNKGSVLLSPETLSRECETSICLTPWDGLPGVNVIGCKLGEACFCDVV